MYAWGKPSCQRAEFVWDPFVAAMGQKGYLSYPTGTKKNMETLTQVIKHVYCGFEGFIFDPIACWA